MPHSGKLERDVILCPSFFLPLISKCLAANNLQKGDVILCPHLARLHVLSLLILPIFFIGKTIDVMKVPMLGILYY